MRTIVFLVILTAVMARPRMSSIDPMTFINGLLTGLELTPGSNDLCSSDVDSLNTLVENMYSDVQAILQGNTADILALIGDAQNFWTQLQAFQTPCNIPQLVSTLQNLFTWAGFETLLANLRTNETAIKADANGIVDCTGNLAQCGEDVGQIIKLSLNWGI